MFKTAGESPVVLKEISDPHGVKERIRELAELL